MSNAYKKLLKNSGIFAIANLGSKLISILLVPFYTYVLSTEQYGTIDMIMTSVSLLLPIITLSIFDATLRFTVKSEYNKKDIFTSSIIVVFVGNLLFVIVYPVLKAIPLISGYVQIFYLVVFFQTINQVFSQFARGIGKIKAFAFNGVINTLVTVTLNIILLAKYKMGINGYFISILISNVVCCIYLIISADVFKFFDFKNYNSSLLKDMLIYSIPLIPNALMWWIMNASDRYVITLFLGLSANGLYAVAYKIPTVLNLLYSIFSQAWQLSAIQEGESHNKSEFYTNVFNVFSIIMLIGTSIILVVIKPIMKILVSESFRESWRYVPFLLLAVVFMSFSSFLGTNYIAMKKTKGVFKTSLIGAIINIILNIILIPIIGINGAAIATMVSFFVVWVIRIYDTRGFVNIKIEGSRLIRTILLIFLQITCLYNFNKYGFIIQLLIFLMILIVNIKLIKEIVIKMYNTLVKKIYSRDVV